MSVSRVLRSTRSRARRRRFGVGPRRSSRLLTPPPPERGSPPAPPRSSASFSSSRAHAHAQAARQARVGAHVAHQHALARRAPRTPPAGRASSSSNRMKFARDGIGAARPGTCARSAQQRVAQPRPGAPRSPRSVARLLERGQRRHLREEVQVVGQARLVDLAHERRARRAGSPRAGRPAPWPWRTCAARPGSGGRASSGTTDSPGELVVRLVHHHQAVRLPRTGAPRPPAPARRPSGCWASRRW